MTHNLRDAHFHHESTGAPSTMDNGSFRAIQLFAPVLKFVIKIADRP